MLRGYHNSLGMLWALPSRQTVVLVFVALYVFGMCIAAVRRVEPLDACLFAALGFTALVWLKTAFIRSDVPQIAVALTPIVVVVSLLPTIEWDSVWRGVVWAIAAVGRLLRLRS